ncbi:hypothetical protein BH09MYX1_BH09MYX1_50890 [soil metagenome]
MKAKRASTSDWIDAGIDLLRSGGEDDLTIDRLAKRVRRTKGSFYHHFKDIDAFRRALLEAWKSSHTMAPIAHAEGESVPRRRPKLYEVVGLLDHRLELAIRGWSARSDDARVAVGEVDARRVDYLTTLWLHQASATRARELAEIEYAAFLGFLQRFGERYVEHAKEMHLLVRALEKLG